MAIDPALADEVQNVAIVQKQNMILRKANLSLRAQIAHNIQKNKLEINELNLENGKLNAKLVEKENEIKLFQIKTRDCIRGGHSAMSEKEYQDASAMLSMVN